MSLISGVTAAAAAVTAQKLEAVGRNFAWAVLTLPATATGNCAWGASNVHVTNGIGAVLRPGESVVIPITGAMNPHNTAALYLSFAANTATDKISWTIKQG